MADYKDEFTIIVRVGKSVLMVPPAMIFLNSNSVVGSNMLSNGGDSSASLGLKDRDSLLKDLLIFRIYL